MPADSPNPATPKPPESNRVVANPAIPRFIDLTLIPSGISLRYCGNKWITPALLPIPNIRGTDVWRSCRDCREVQNGITNGGGSGADVSGLA